MIEEKRNKIKNSLRITRERRKTQDVIILKLKIDNDKLNNKSIKTLNTIFLEAKWLYNYILDKEFNNDIFNIDSKIKNVNVYVKDHYETRELKYLSLSIFSLSIITSCVFLLSPVILNEFLILFLRSSGIMALFLICI